MNDIILKIVENLLGTSIGFVGLIFAALSILLSINDENWQIRRLKKSIQYQKFISLTANLAVWFMVLFILSVFVLVANKAQWFSPDIFSYILYAYIGILFILSMMIIIVSYRFKQLFVLLSNNEKPNISE
jgi:magnesium-transporting ATPase (P-type)